MRVNKLTVAILSVGLFNCAFGFPCLAQEERVVRSVTGAISRGKPPKVYSQRFPRGRKATVSAIATGKMMINVYYNKNKRPIKSSSVTDAPVCRWTVAGTGTHKIQLIHKDQKKSISYNLEIKEAR